jgi:hypothetical protein
VAKVVLTSKSSAMKSYLPLLSLLAVLSSCSTAYRSGQTPDDVYFSPARPVQEYVKNEEEENRQQYRGERERDEAYREDRYIRMRVRNRRWSTLDDATAWNYHPIYNNPWNYNSPWNSVAYWNFVYNPYCCCSTPVGNPARSAVYNRPRTFNLGAYTPSQPSSGTNIKGPASRSSNSGNGNYNNSGSNAGGFLRGLFGGGSSSNSGSSSSPSTKTSSGSSSSGSSGSSGGSAPSRRF